MNRIVVAFVFLCALCLLRIPAAMAITIDTVPIGNAGNPADPSTGYGSVGYNYSIGKYDVTFAQYTTFLNSVAASDPYGLYSIFMTDTLTGAGISRSGTSGSYTYSVFGSPNRPVTVVSWGDAARFANWMNNGQPTGSENASTTEDGAYTLNGATTDAALNAVVRNSGATWFIPTENEWYKAAYYDPVAEQYWQYPTGTNTPPTSAPSGSTPNTANYFDPTTGYALTGSTTLDRSRNYLTDVGAYSASASPYGTFDQGGDVFQWNETLVSSSQRGLRGGSWDAGSTLLASSSRLDDLDSAFENIDVGFRLATVPEPSTVVLALLGFATMCALKKRR